MIKNMKIRILIIVTFSHLLFGLEDPLNFTTSMDRIDYRGGETLTLILDINMDPGFHIYSVHPDKSLKPTNIKIEDTTLFNIIGIINEPPPITKYDKNFGMDVGMHFNNITLTKKFLLDNNLEPGKYTVDCTLEYLICDKFKCIPKWDDFTLTIPIIKGDPRDELVSIINPVYSSLNEKVFVNDEEFNQAVKKGLFPFILFAMTMGFLALLTPCVFPMIPITVSFFTKQGETGNMNPISSALIYTIGIIIIFSGLGLMLAFTLGATGANQLASSPLVNIFIALLFIYFAFSLFGYYEIKLPSLFQQFSINQENRGGIVGILFMALTFTLTSFTCTVQFVGLLLVAASQGAYFWPIVGMLAFSFTFALPFFFLALFPQYLAKLPKSGGWLNSVKVIMGFLELGAAMKFLSNVDLVLGWGIFTYQSVLASWMILSIIMGIYLLGKIQFPYDSKIDNMGTSRIVLSLSIFLFSMYLGSGLIGRPIHGLIDSYLPPNLEMENQTLEIEGLHWIEDYEEAKKISQDTNKPMFLDFTGYTCTNCRWMEINIFTDERVQEHFKDYVLVRLYTDGKEEKHKQYQRMEELRFNTVALPFYVILSPDDQEIDRFPGMDIDVNKFIVFLEGGKIF